MYDAREKANLDRQWALNQSFREGEARGEARGKFEKSIQIVQSLQGILDSSIMTDDELREMNLDQLDKLTTDLQNKIRNRMSS